ncbi:MAG: c-type cytochrome [Candidatus Scalinduaceae bacterium]
MEKYKLIQRKLGVSISFMLVVLTFYACQPVAVYSKEHVFTLKPKESFEIRNGRIAYNEHCAPCHGDAGKGDGKYYASGLEPKPRNFTDSEFMSRVQDEYLLEVIKKGTAAFGRSPYCPPWGDTLKEDEKVWNIIFFLRTLAGE